MYKIRALREQDIPHLAVNLRSHDVRELIAASGSVDTLGSITRSVRTSEECLVATENNLPILIWGISPVFGTVALIWAVATPAVQKYPSAFFRQGRSKIRTWFEERPALQTLMNFTFAENTLHHRWLKWCGAELFPEAPFGPRGAPFKPFVIRRDFYDV